MAIEVNGKIIETDEEGYLTNRADWNMDVAAAIAKAEKVEMTESHWGLVEAVRIFYEEQQRRPSSSELVQILGQHVKESAHEVRHDVNAFLYKLFPYSPEKQLAKIAGLPKPLPADVDG